MSLIDLSRPTVIGITTPGNNTVLRNGSIDKTSGISSEFMISSSSEDNNGKNSVSSLILLESRLFILNGSKILMAAIY